MISLLLSVKDLDRSVQDETSILSGASDATTGGQSIRIKDIKTSRGSFTKLPDPSVTGFGHRRRGRGLS